MECVAGHPMNAGQRYCPECGLLAADPVEGESNARPPVFDGVESSLHRAPAARVTSPKPPGRMALVFSLLGLLTCGVTAVVGLVLGILARNQARREGLPTGNAVAAIVTGSVVIAGGVALVVLGSIFGSQSSDSSTASVSTPSRSDGSPSEETEAVSENVSESNYQDLLVGEAFSDEVCASYVQLLDEYDATLEKRQSRLEGIGTDPYKAAKFVEKNAWTTGDLKGEYEQDWREVASGSFNSLSSGSNIEDDALNSFLEASLEGCSLSDRYAAQVKVVEKVNGRQSSVLRAADNKPWFPKGFQTYSPGIAIKWTDESCGSSYGYCWTMRVISQQACSGGLYAEVNILQDGVVTGYSNDLLGSLPALTEGKLEFQDFGGSGTKSASLSEINCY